MTASDKDHIIESLLNNGFEVNWSYGSGSIDLTITKSNQRYMVRYANTEDWYLLIDQLFRRAAYQQESVKPDKYRGMKFDAIFESFQQLNRLLDIVLPKGSQLPAYQADAVHQLANDIAERLTSGQFVYTPRRTKHTA